MAATVPQDRDDVLHHLRDATIVKLRKEIRDKANDRERKLREAYELNDFDPTAMDTVDG